MSDSIIHSNNAPEPVGEYPHARRVGQFLFLSGVGSRIPESNEIPGGPIYDSEGTPLPYDVAAQTEQVIQNIQAVLSSCNLTLEDVVDVTAFLVDMERDFESYNKVYAQHFKNIQAARTTIAIRALPTPIAVEFKVVAVFPS